MPSVCPFQPQSATQNNSTTETGKCPYKPSDSSNPTDQSAAMQQLQTDMISAHKSAGICPYKALPTEVKKEHREKCPYLQQHGNNTSDNMHILGEGDPLSIQDPEMYQLIQKEKYRQKHCIELIASENFTSKAVMQVLGSCLTNKYSEGQIGARYYGGNEIIDQVEELCKTRCLAAFGLNEKEWGVNVQPYSGSPANFAVYTGLLKPHDRVMGLELASGGHLTHGYYTASGKKISATSIYFESFPYQVDVKTGLIDFDDLLTKAKIFRPQMILCGASAYPRIIDFSKFRAIADEVGAILMADVAHISGLIATGNHPSPFGHAHVVTSTTHKSLRGPRSGMIFYPLGLENEYKLSLENDPSGKEAIASKKFPLPFINYIFKENESVKNKIDMAVFPALQGGPHNHQIGALAVQFKEVQTEEFSKYMKNVVINADALATAMKNEGFHLVSNGTDNHLLLVDCVKSFDINGKKMEKICDVSGITLNKNTIPGDTNALTPSGVRIGTCAMTTRLCDLKDMKIIAAFLKRAALIAKKIQDVKGRKLKDWEAGVESDEEVIGLKKEIAEWVGGFYYPGV